MQVSPTFIATSVVRGSQQGDSHGGVYLIDFHNQEVRQPIDWNSVDIDFQGRGWDRGLRGIAFDDDDIYIAASDELFVYGPDFAPRGSFRNPFLKHGHEICRYGRNLFVTSTGYNSLLAFDLDKKKFTWGLHILGGSGGFSAREFDPLGPGGPEMSNRHHINNVYCDDTGMYLSGRGTGLLLRFNGKSLAPSASLPLGVHNARPLHEGVVFNDTENDVLRYVAMDRQVSFPVATFPLEELTHTHMDDSAIARQGFGRGLCVVDEMVVAAGSSPSTVSLYDLEKGRSGTRVNLTMDIRNAIHGLELWPF